MASRRAFVMGHPIAHSRSPMLHGYWLALYGIDGSYEPLDIRPGDLASFFDGYRQAGWAGGNVTVPHKTAVMRFVDRLEEIGGLVPIEAPGDADDDDLARATRELGELEAEVSAVRRKLFDRIDTLQGEITRRYRTGEASVETLLET